MKSLPVLSLMMGLSLSGAAAKADSLSLTIFPASQTAFVGDPTPLVFDATVTDTDIVGSDPVLLEGDNITLNNGPTSLPVDDLVDDSPYFNNFPLSMGPGDTFTGELLDVTISDPTTPFGLYEGTFQILDANSNELAVADFSINVTPEPSSLLLLLTGMAGLAVTLRRRLIR